MAVLSMSWFSVGRRSRRIARLAGGALAGAVMLAASPAEAVEDLHLGIEATTDFPIAIGGRVSLEVPLRFRLTTSFGVMPPPYIGLVNEVVVAAGGYDELTASVIEDAIGNAFVWRTQVGWRPFGDYGFYVDGGYTLATLGGGLNGVEVLALAAGVPPPDGVMSDLQFEVDSTLHMLTIEIGYEWVFFDHLVIRGALGYTGTMASNTSVVASGAPFQRLTDAFADGVADYLDDTYTTYVHVPTITLGIGYRIF